MTATTRRALVRVQHAARRLVQAVSALRPKEQKAMPFVTKLLIWPTWLASRLLAWSLRKIEADKPKSRPQSKPAPTLASVGDYRTDDAADEARDVAREMREASESWREL